MVTPPEGKCACCGKHGRLYKAWCRTHYEHWYRTGRFPTPTPKEQQQRRKDEHTDE